MRTAIGSRCCSVLSRWGPKQEPAGSGTAPGATAVCRDCDYCAAFHAEQVQPNRADFGHPDAGVVTLEEHVAYAGHPEGLPAIGPTVASAGAGPWASTIRSPQVVSRHFTLFRVPGIGVSAGQLDFCSGFDSRQLHELGSGQDESPGLISFPSDSTASQLHRLGRNAFCPAVGSTSTTRDRTPTK